MPIKMTPEMTVHHPMHHRGGSCITVSLPKLIHPFTCLVAVPTGSGNILSKTATGTKK